MSDWKNCRNCGTELEIRGYGNGSQPTLCKRCPNCRKQYKRIDKLVVEINPLKTDEIIK